MGSIHLFYDIQLQANRLSAQTFADMQDDDKFLVPTPWVIRQLLGLTCL